MKSHAVRDALLRLKLSTRASIKPYYPRTRDRADVSVLHCERSGVYLLSSTDHINVAHYHGKEFNGRGARSRAAALKATVEDSRRRAAQFRRLIRGKKWIDIGAGAGGILDALRAIAKEAVGVEPQDKSRESLMRAGYRAYTLTKDVPDREYDVATLFHVFEHLQDPMSELRRIRSLLKKGGSIIIEVPHAGDALVSLYECDAFKAHTFWSEHLLLHTKRSLRTFLKAAGFRSIEIAGFQRYPLANHLHWLAKGKPGGQKTWPQLAREPLSTSYAEALEDMDATDTIIAVARK